MWLALAVFIEGQKNESKRPSMSVSSSGSGLFTKSAGSFGTLPLLPMHSNWRDSSHPSPHPDSMPVSSTGDMKLDEDRRIPRSAVVDSIREATQHMEPALAASVQSAALSQMQPDERGLLSQEDVARVWSMTVLPGLERAPCRGPSGELMTRRLTERLQRLLGSQLSQLMLQQLPLVQRELRLTTDPTGGGLLPADLVRPFVSALASAVLPAAIGELGDALLALPGLDCDTGGAGGVVGSSGAGGVDGIGRADGAGARPSQADALGAAEALMRRMLEGALHGHHAALALAEERAAGDTSGVFGAAQTEQPSAQQLSALGASSPGASSPGASSLGASSLGASSGVVAGVALGAPLSPTAREVMRAREVRGEVSEVRAAHDVLDGMVAAARSPL